MYEKYCFFQLTKLYNQFSRVGGLGKKLHLLQGPQGNFVIFKTFPSQLFHSSVICQQGFQLKVKIVRGKPFSSSNPTLCTHYSFPSHAVFVSLVL